MISELECILNPHIVIPKSSPNNHILIAEDGLETKLGKLEVNFLPSESIAFTLDYDGDKENRRLYNQLTHYINKSVDKVNKSCDLVLVGSSNGVCTVSLVELKSNAFKDTEVFDQLRNSKIYIQYLISMIKEYYPSLDNEKILFKEVVVSTQVRSNKRTVHPSGRKAPLFKKVTVTTDESKKASVGYGQLV